MTAFNIIRDVTGAVSYGRQLSANAYSATLAQNTDTTLTVPYIDAMGNINQNNTTYPNIVAILSYTPGESVWVANNTSAASTAGATFASTSSELNPSVIYVKGGDIMHFYSTQVGVDVSVSFYSLD